MKIRVLAVLVSLAVLILQVPVRCRTTRRRRAPVSCPHRRGECRRDESVAGDQRLRRPRNQFGRLGHRARGVGFGATRAREQRILGGHDRAEPSVPVGSAGEGRVGRRHGPRRGHSRGAGPLSESQRRARQNAGDCQRPPVDRAVRGPHRRVPDAADVRRPAHVRAEDLRQRRHRRGRTGDADRRHPPRARDQCACHRARGRQ